MLPEELDVDDEWSWTTGGDELIPDVVVCTGTGETVRLIAVPVLAVEILSSNRASDLVMRSVKYAAAGLPHYWIVDLRDGVLDVFELVDGVYVARTHVTSDEPADVAFGPASLRVDLRELTARRRPRG